jgi:hypothetical protein
MAERQQLLNPQQEHELVLYIERCVRHGLQPTREMIKHFAATLAKWKVSESWVSQFLHCHANKLTIKSGTGVNCNWHKANSKERYMLYFDMWYSKMQ